MNLDLQSERYAATGNISGSGVRRSLGTPTLNPLRILIREAGQNAWDARRDDETPVTFRVHVRSLSAAERSSVTSLLSALPSGSPTKDQIEQSLQRSPIGVIEISDWGTAGLGGPVRADEEPESGERANFANFFRNIGSPRDRALGAGTYGYGKSALYRMSRCGTVIAYTQTRHNGRGVTRLMAGSIGDAFAHKRRRYTGRHWWGAGGEGDVVDPVQGVKAHSAAESIGLTRRGADELGTSILILDPDLEERSHLQAGNAVLECLAWFFWPKMISRANRQPSMCFEVAVDGSALQVPDLRAFPPLEILVDAMTNAKGPDARKIACERPIQSLGRLGFAKGPRRRRVVLDTGSEHQLIPERSACVALMRPAELVVKYLQGPPLASDMVEYAGVFICDDSVEANFADAEPPAHDDWVPDFLEGRGKTFVRVALRRIDMATEQYGNPPAFNPAAGEQLSLGGLGDALGDVLLGQVGSRLGSHGEGGGSTGGSSGGKRTLSISEAEPFRFAVVKRTPCAVFRVQVTSSRAIALKLEAKPFIVLEGNSVEPAEGRNAPRVVGWLDAKGDLLAEGPQIKLASSGKDILHVAVSVVDDAAITVAVDNLSDGR